MTAGYYSNPNYISQRARMGKSEWGRLPLMGKPVGDKTTYLPGKEGYNPTDTDMAIMDRWAATSSGNAQDLNSRLTVGRLRRKRHRSTSRGALQSANKRGALAKRAGGIKDVGRDAQWWGKTNPWQQGRSANSVSDTGTWHTCGRQRRNKTDEIESPIRLLYGDIKFTCALGDTSKLAKG